MKTLQKIRKLVVESFHVAEFQVAMVPFTIPVKISVIPMTGCGFVRTTNQPIRMQDSSKLYNDYLRYLGNL